MTTETSYCRLCARLKPNDKLLNLKTNQQKLHEIIEKLNFINGGTDFSDGVLPKAVCLLCIASLDQAFDFVMSIQHAQKILAGIFITQNVKQESACSFDKDVNNPQSDCYIKIKIEHDDEQNTEEHESKMSLIETKMDESTDDENNLNDKQHFVLSTEHKGFITVEVSKQSKEQSNASTSTTKTFPKESKHIPEMKMTWKDYFWSCKFCETQFPHIDELTSHSMTYHNVCNAFRCLDCNKSTVKLDKFLIHVKRHKNDLKLSCYKCNKAFHTSRETLTHAKEHKCTDYVCDGCNMYFPTRELLNEHTEIYFKESRARSTHLYMPQIPEEVTDLRCKFCEKDFSNILALRKHLMTHMEKPKAHICEKCGKTFSNNNNLTMHLISVHGNARPYVCEICKATFKTRLRLRNHVRTHDKTKPYTCDKCGKVFRTHEHLKSHSIVHTDLLPYKCTYCEKKFRFKPTLQVHLNQHTGVKPYNCEICQRAFTNWPNYNKHMKRRHGKDMSKKKANNMCDDLRDTVTEEIVPEKIKEWKRNILTKLKPGRKKFFQEEANSKSDMKNCENVQ